MTGAGLTGTPRLTRLALRRDRIALPLWVVSLVGLTWATVASVTALYSSQAERVAAAAFTAATPVARIFDGPASGPSLGALTMVELYGALGVFVGLMSITTVTRHTRQNEETGRAELIGSGVVGHRALLAAALLVAVGASTAVGAGVTVVLLLSGLPADGSILSGATVAALGCVFGAVAAVTAQVASSQRAANGLAAVVLGMMFFLRAIGDAAGEVAPSGVELVSAWPSWLSPIGWGQQARAFHTQRWEVLLLFAAALLLLVLLSFVLVGRRDLGAGLLPERPGPPTASRVLRSPLGLSWRLQWRLLLGWATALAAMALAFGWLGDQADDLVGLSDDFAAYFEALSGEGALLDAYVAVMMGLLGMVAAGYTVQALLRARTEESSGRLEPVLATAVGRSRWLLSGSAVAIAGTVVVVALIGLVGSVGYGLATGDWSGGLSRFLPAALVQIAPVLTLAGFVIACFAVAPRWATGLSWAALALSLVMAQFGELLGLPRAVRNLSPFSHAPALPLEPFTSAPLLLLAGAAVLLGGAGIAWFHRRDLQV
jgi:ABC-2 type transport system permease protein